MRRNKVVLSIAALLLAAYATYITCSLWMFERRTTARMEELENSIASLRLTQRNTVYRLSCLAILPQVIERELQNAGLQVRINSIQRWQSKQNSRDPGRKHDLRGLKIVFSEAIPKNIQSAILFRSHVEKEFLSLQSFGSSTIPLSDLLGSIGYKLEFQDDGKAIILHEMKPDDLRPGK